MKKKKKTVKGSKHNSPSIINVTINASGIIAFTCGTLLHFANRAPLNERYHLVLSVIALKSEICMSVDYFISDKSKRDLKRHGSNCMCVFKTHCTVADLSFHQSHGTR